MRSAIITGTGVYNLSDVSFKRQVVDTAYGEAVVYLPRGGAENFVFLARHGPERNIPPHRINYRANIKALQLLGVERILAAFTVGSINPNIPPNSLALLSDFLDFTNGRHATFFDESCPKVVYTDMSTPYCPALGRQLVKLAPEFDLKLYSSATYVTSNGPRLETPAEIRMFGRLGGDVIGMTGVPEVVLSRELNMHYTAVAQSINWAAGIKEGPIAFSGVELDKIHIRLLRLFIKTLDTTIELYCDCYSDDASAEKMTLT